MNGMLGLYCYTAAAQREIERSALVDTSRATEAPGSGRRLSDSWWNPLRPRLAGSAARA